MLTSLTSLNYQTPPFPSLYLITVNRDHYHNATLPRYLNFTRDIWKFTLYWHLILYFGAHTAVLAFAIIVRGLGVCSELRSYSKAVFSHKEARRQGPCLPPFGYGWSLLLAPTGYLLLAGLESLFAGSIVGLLLAAIYQIGGFRVTTWIPFAWALLDTLVLVVSSFAVHGGLQGL